MTKTLLLALSLLVSAEWVLAQYPTTGSSQTGAASGQTTVQGCLQGSNGISTLTDKSGTTVPASG